MKLYLDNAATTFPKPPSMVNAMSNYMCFLGSNPGRGSSSSSVKSGHIVFQCREALASFFKFPKCENIIFTNNITTSLNILIKGLLKKGDHAITSSMDHNATLRPLTQLKNDNIIDLTIVKCSEEGFISVEDFKNAIKSNTKLVVLSHASNIIGSIQPVSEIGAICKEKGIFFIIDSAQTAGVLDLNFQNLNCDALAFTGHKSLLGPQGIGGFLINDHLNNNVRTIIEGGTGSISSSVVQPDFLPDKFESGTLNTPGIAGLMAGIEYINSTGLETIKNEEQELTSKFINDVINIDSIKVYGSMDCSKRTSTVSLNSSLIDNSELGYILDSEYGIATRTGLHCAPLAHETIGSFPTGTIRFSFGVFNTVSDVKYAVDCINKIIKTCI
ncbi:cysteine desulfurase family protein [Hathewaya proteolytica DSM 3090]|uniref:cysteine desulfurase n=1 Tax=Hathewaya proteolytica DSM 3090 TaxID=1121331 RepID=A0A1M6MNZ0_9CLOT|nr:aminotransferase class V-fold PLP-dependent enzyme [Hathewaya proteolytica]SHJ85139.1 cysteine desulfurase family protein [Hathewaya proteolytica DSM 3090]